MFTRLLSGCNSSQVVGPMTSVLSQMLVTGRPLFLAPWGLSNRATCFIKACVQADNILLARQKSQSFVITEVTSPKNCHSLLFRTKGSKGKDDTRPRIQEQGSVGVILQAASTNVTKSTCLCQFYHNLINTEMFQYLKITSIVGVKDSSILMPSSSVCYLSLVSPEFFALRFC